MIGIYKLINVINGKIYIGKSKDIKKRMKYHKDDYKKNSKRNNVLYKAFKKYGIENFKLEIVEICNIDDLDEKEEYYIKKFDATNPEIGYNFSEKSLAFKDEKVRKNNAITNGKFLSQYNKKMWENKEYRGQKSKLSRELQLERLKNKEYLEEKTRQLKKATDKMKLKVGKYDKLGNLLEVYNGIREAERNNNLPNDSVGKVCRGSKYRKTAGGYIWKYLDKEEV